MTEPEPGRFVQVATTHIWVKVDPMVSVAHGLGYAIMWSALTVLLAVGSLMSTRLRVGYAAPSPAVSGATRG